MGIPECEKLSIDDFFDAISGIQVRYELVGGVGYAMAGAKEGRNVMSSDVQTALPLRRDIGSYQDQSGKFLEGSFRQHGQWSSRSPDVMDR